MSFTMFELIWGASGTFRLALLDQIHLKMHSSKTQLHPQKLCPARHKTALREALSGRRSLPRVRGRQRRPFLGGPSCQLSQ